ncbi:MAG TPA: hypothetical protein VJJ78_04395 [Candidatus Saccharimonadales bacterium]|nr:hypothetical protein [Candidatus Saccharimonadales bacterium]
MSDFRDFRLEDIAANPRGVYDLAEGLLPEMANAMGYELGGFPDSGILSGFINHIGPAKTLQDNIGLVQERLATQVDAVTIASDWAERSGSLWQLARTFRGSFSRPNKSLPKSIDSAVFNTAVGRWQERRAQKIMDLEEQGTKVARIAIMAGNRTMNEVEHPMVATLARQDGVLPTEARFATAFIAEMLKTNMSVPVFVFPSDSSVGDDIFLEGIRQRERILDDSILAVGNAPSALQVAGQFRKAARTIAPEFDDHGYQLFMSGDSIPVARQGEGPETHQNPFTALGQIARNALVLHEEAKSLR